MTLLTLSEPLVTDIKHHLDDKLQGYVDAVNARFTDPEYPIDYPMVLDFMPTISYLTSFPVVAVAEGEITSEGDVGWSFIGEHDLSIVVFEQCFDQRQLAFHMRRLMSAALSCVMEGRNVTGWGLRLGSVSPGPILRRRESPDGRDVLGIRSASFSIRDEQE